MSAHEIAEKIEHATHANGHAGSGKHIGITMAILGVMLAFSAAMVGSQRTELIKTMVQQSNKWGVYQTETMKYRVMQADYELLKSISPKPDEIQKVEKTLREKRTQSGKADDEDTAEIKDLIASSTEDMADLLTPDPEELTRFHGMARAYDRDMREAKEDAEAYEGAITVHEQAAERYEWAQLAAEIGIVIASIALLLGNRLVWMVSVVLGVVCAGSLGWTFADSRRDLAAAELKIKAALENVQKLEEDDEAIEAVHPEPGNHVATPARVPAAHGKP
jgi:hypothetical protein